MNGSFDGVALSSIAGYRVSACYTPGGGGQFLGHFYVTLLDRTQAGTKFATGIDLGAGGRSRRGSLQFADAYREYSFNNIDLTSLEAGATRNQRYRFLQFKYDEQFGRSGLDVTMSNTSNEKLADNPLQQDYDASLVKTNEHLLGFRTGLIVDGANIQRFVTLRAGDNSMLVKLIDIGKQEAKNTKFPDFTIGFSQANVPVKQTTVSRIYVHESWGSFHDAPLPSLAAIRAAQLNDDLIDDVLRVSLDDFSSKKLLEFNDSPKLDSFKDSAAQVVTLVMQQGQQSMVIT